MIALVLYCWVFLLGILVGYAFCRWTYLSEMAALSKKLDAARERWWKSIGNNTPGRKAP